MKTINIAISDELHYFFKMYSVEQKTTMKDLIIEFIESVQKQKQIDKKEKQDERVSN